MIILAWILKLIGKFLRLSGLGGGTALPGIIIERFFPSFISKYTKNYDKIVLVTGTNGKTTTQKLTRHILENADVDVVSNTSGANLIRGIASSIINDMSIFGKVRSDVAVFEVEEATMPILCDYVNASYIIVTNLYRDQLDAYGEVMKTREYIITGIKKQRRATIVLLGDDENVSSIANEVKNRTVLFSVRDKRTKEIFYEKPSFRYKSRKNVSRVYANYVKIQDDLSTRFNIYGSGKPIRDVHFQSPGIHYIYNAVAAVAVANRIKKQTSQKIRIAFEKFDPAFGRGEIIRVDDKTLRLLLIKNPASFTATLQMLEKKIDLKLLIIINDNIADGRDVSWLWDSRLEILDKENISWVTVSGTRAKDMMLRLKYADIGSLNVEVEEHIQKALDISLSNLNKEETLYILPTYTAMLDVRKFISNITDIKKFWK